MEDTASLGIVIAFTAGLLSFLSPCVLPLIPSYVTFITGLSLEEVQKTRRLALVHSLLFILGFTLIFLALGATATVLGRALLVYREWISRVGGVLVIVFGLYLLGVFNIAALARERRVHLADKPIGYVGTVLVGIAFGAGMDAVHRSDPWLHSHLHLELGGPGTRSWAADGVLNGTRRSLSRGVARDQSLHLVLHAGARHMMWVSRAGGVLLILVGVLLLTDYFTVLAGYLQRLTPDALRNRIWFGPHTAPRYLTAD